MKALITAGGKGTRLRPMTNTQNKHLIPIANKPILQYAIDYVVEAGIKEIGIIVNSGSSEIQDYFKDGKNFGASITYIEQEAPLGLAHVVKISEDFISKDNFIFYLGDNMVVGGIRDFINKFEKSNCNCFLTLANVKDPERFGVPEIKNDRIISIEEKPVKPKSNYAVAGIYFYDSSIFKAVNSIKPSERGELEISDAHQYLIDNNYKLGYCEITGWWKDTGKPIDLLEANRLILDNITSDVKADVDENSYIAGKVIAGKNSKIINSNIRGPVIIGDNCIIENSYIGPFTSIDSDSIIKNSEVEYSVILKRCKIKNVNIRIEGSLLGQDVQILEARDKPKTHRFMLGDQSLIEIV